MSAAKPVFLLEDLKRTMTIMENAFSDFDVDKCGQISLAQLNRKLSLLGFKDQDKLQQVFKSVDRNQTGSLGFAEFLMLMYFWNDVGPNAYQILFQEAGSAETINRAFLLMEECYIRYDLDKSRRLNHDEFLRFLSEQLPTISSSQETAAILHHHFPQTKPYLRFSEFLFVLYKLLLPRGASSTSSGRAPLVVSSPVPEQHTGGKCSGGTGLWHQLEIAFEAMERDFTRFDSDHNACIDLAELTQGLSSARPSSELIEIMGRLEAYFQEVDLDGSGSIDFFEFMYLMYLMIQNGAYRDIIHNPVDAGAVKKCLMHLRECYSKYDRDASRRLDRDELNAFFTESFGEIPPRSNEIFTRLQTSPQRPHIDFCRFMRLLYEVVMPSGRYLAISDVKPPPTKSAPKLIQTYTGAPVAASRRIPRVDPIDPKEVVKDVLIGQGGFGCVYSAKFRGNVVAAKYLSESASAEVAEETEKEVQLMRTFDHVNIVYLVGACTSLPDVCIVTELCKNGSLFDCIHKQRLQFDNASLWRIARETAVGLNVLHEMKPVVIHRDIKSLNVLLDENFTVKICDFGLSKALTGTAKVQTRGVGTPQWTAPEVLSSGNYGTPSDVYSYGILLWEMWHRQVPYGNMDASQIVLSVVMKNNRPLISRKCPEKMARFMVWCWDQDPARRPSFRQVVQQLDAVKGEFCS